MLLAALYDIHGNLPALEAALEEIRDFSLDGVIVGGDVLPGPMPHETLDVLQNLDVPVHFIQGNGEIAVLDELAGRAPSGVPEPYRPIISWTAQQLNSENQRTIAAWPQTTSIAIPSFGNALFCHATPRNENEIFTRLTPEAALLPAFVEVYASVVVCGHTHMQFDRIVGSVRVVNAGSVGMPFGEPRADWLLLGADIEFRHTYYDLAKAAERIRQTGYPRAEEFASINVLQPPSEAKMLEFFARAEIK